MDLLFSNATEIKLSGNSPHISTAAALYMVNSGEADLFYISDNGELRALCTFTTGDVFCIPAKMQISGHNNSIVKELMLADCSIDAQTALKLTDVIFTYVDKIISCLDLNAPAGKSLTGRQTSFNKGSIVRSSHTPAFIQVETSGQFCDTAKVKSGDYLFLSRNTWLTCNEENQITLHQPTPQKTLAALENLCYFIAQAISDHQKSFEQLWSQKAQQQQLTDIESFHTTLYSLSNVMESKSEHHNISDELTCACFEVASASGIKVAAQDVLPVKSVEDYAAQHSVRCRKIRLDKLWYKSDCGPIIAYRNDRPVALLPDGDGYVIAGDNPQLVSEEISNEFNEFGWTLFESLPPDTVTWRDIITLSWKGSERDLRWIILLGILTGILGMATPAVTGTIISHVIPTGEYGMLFELGLGLLAASIAGALFGLVQNFAMMRLTSRSGFRLQAAIWDRLLALPASFFGKYDSGDLATRAMGIIAIRDIISQHLLSSTLAIAVGAFNLIVAIIYSWQLTCIVVAFSFISCLAGFFLSLYQLKFQRKVQKLSGELQGLVLQLITGISKIRIAGSEIRAFARWSELFAKQKKFHFDYSIFAQLSGMLFSVMPLLQTAFIFYFIISMNADERLTTGSYMAFTAASAQITIALGAISGLSMAIIQALPQYERAGPILTTATERHETTAQAINLSGNIELRSVCFSYEQDSKILNDISIKANPGDFIAFVGPSGAGKSTLLKLLLGLEKPSSGSVLYDETDISHLNIKELRKQFGVVLQGGGIMQGSIFSNVCGAKYLSQEEAWRALEVAGLAEEISKMPMGIHTVLPQGGGVLSGGQQQRLMIARALAANPRILFFDEATSALDNRLQSEVSHNIEQFNLTRIVIAHRLSTIRNADKIYVMDKGRIVQSGTYDELVNDSNGLFSQLCKRQTA